MCKDLNIQIVAEGIETASNANLVKTLVVDYIQGHYYSKPLNKTEFSDYLVKSYI